MKKDLERQAKRIHPKEKAGLHPRNRHRERYDFSELVRAVPELEPFVRLNDYQDASIVFSNPDAVMTLNRALLKKYYGIDHWRVPQGYLCPPVPGRADYIHHIADLLGQGHGNTIPLGARIRCLDIGVGANCVYPIIGNKEYGWSFVGSDVSSESIVAAKRIITENPSLHGHVALRLQAQPNHIFHGVIQEDERFDVTICNPPFHASLKEAQSGSLRKLSNLTGKRITQPTLNFGGMNAELFCAGGEERFVKTMISESRQYASSCFWFSTLISKSSHLNEVYHALEHAKVFDVNTIPMAQGNKISRIVAWTYLDAQAQRHWMETRWRQS